MQPQEPKQSDIPDIEKIEYEDIEGGGPTQATGIKDIILRQYQRCCTEGSKEMNSGGVKKRVINGQVYEIAVPNQIEIFINSVEILKISLIPKLDKDTKPIEKKIDGKYEELDKINKSYDSQANELINSSKPNNEKWITKYRDYFNKTLATLGRGRELIKVDIYRKILIDLGEIMKGLNYFEEFRSYT